MTPPVDSVFTDGTGVAGVCRVVVGSAPVVVVDRPAWWRGTGVGVLVLHPPPLCTRAPCSTRVVDGGASGSAVHRDGERQGVAAVAGMLVMTQAMESR